MKLQSLAREQRSAVLHSLQARSTGLTEEFGQLQRGMIDLRAAYQRVAMLKEEQARVSGEIRALSCQQQATGQGLHAAEADLHQKYGQVIEKRREQEQAIRDKRAQEAADIRASEQQMLADRWAAIDRIDSQLANLPEGRQREQLIRTREALTRAAEDARRRLE